MDIYGKKKIPALLWHINIIILMPSSSFKITGERESWVCLFGRTNCLCFETNFDDAADRKTAKYTDLVQQARANGYRATLPTLQVGSRGVPHYQSFLALARVLDMTNKDFMTLITNTTKAAIQGSFKSGVPAGINHVSLYSLLCLYVLTVWYVSCLWGHVIVR